MRKKLIDRNNFLTMAGMKRMLDCMFENDDRLRRSNSTYYLVLHTREILYKVAPIVNYGVDNEASKVLPLAWFRGYFKTERKSAKCLNIYEVFAMFPELDIETAQANRDDPSMLSTATTRIATTTSADYIFNDSDFFGFKRNGQQGESKFTNFSVSVAPLKTGWLTTSEPCPGNRRLNLCLCN